MAAQHADEDVALERAELEIGDRPCRGRSRYVADEGDLANESPACTVRTRSPSTSTSALPSRMTQKRSPTSPWVITATAIAEARPRVRRQGRRGRRARPQAEVIRAAGSLAAVAAEHVPLTEKEIEAATVGELVPHNATINLADYDPLWPALYEREAARVRGALGPAALRLEHVGSTSVPGLAAKPLIDMVLVVADSSDEDAYVPALEASGYVLRIREPDWYEHRLFKGPDTNVNVHTFSDGCVEVDRMVAFRDWLRTHNDDRGVYERAKRELAAREWRHVQNYADAKSAVVAEIMERAHPG
jgi:GrpB-like predicted nucleotidyltransferase (UPF0157 family)